MYQSAHPDRFFSPENIGTNGNVFLEDGSTVDADTPLLPFRNPSGDFWTPNTIRDTKTFGYAYPETIHSAEKAGPSKTNVNFATFDGSARGINASIARLYGVSTHSRLLITGPTAGLDATATKFTDWSILTSSSSQATFVARFFFVGDFSSDPVVDVGSWVRMMPSSHTRSTALADKGDARKKFEGKLSLTSSLLDAISEGKLTSLKEKDVVPFLKGGLSWRVLDVSELLLIAKPGELSFASTCILPARLSYRTAF
jgi:tyrosinase